MINAAKKTAAEFRETAAATGGGRTALKLAHQSIFPSAIARRLALSESGFVFDPVSGQSFTVNEAGLAVLRLAQVEEDVAKLLSKLAEQFDATAEEIKRDALDFAERLKDFIK
jgi:hypothetical protein